MVIVSLDVESRADVTLSWGCAAEDVHLVVIAYRSA
jgi:hypothetical protein